MPFICQTERLIIRPLTLEDSTFVIELVNSPGWLTYIGDRHIHTPEQAQQYLQQGPLASYRQNGYGLYCVVLKQNDTPIGMCGLIKRDTLPQPDIGFALLPAYAGKGYGYEAAMAVQSLALDQLNIPTLYAITLPGNLASIKLLQKIGMEYVNPFWHNGEELRLYQLLKRST